MRPHPELQSAKLGLPALCMLTAGFLTEFGQELRPGQDCYHLITDWLWRAGSIGLLLMLLSFLLAVIGLSFDHRRIYAILVLVGFVPCLLLVAGASGCG